MNGAQPTSPRPDEGFRARFLTAYTAAPALHSNPVVATLQLFVWLFFRPSAWRSHIARIDPTLPADFNLAKLTRAQFAAPSMRRLLLLGHVVAPLLIGGLVTVELLALHVPAHFIAIRVTACVLMTIGTSLIFAAGSADAVGMACGMAGALTGSGAFALAVIVTGQLTFPVEARVSVAVTDFLAGGAAGRTTLMIAFAAPFGGMLAAVGRGGAGLWNRKARISRGRQLGGTLIGGMIGAVCFGVATAAALFLPFPIAISAGGFFAGVVAAAWFTRSWMRTLIIGVICALHNHLLVNIVAPASHDVVILGMILGIILGAWFSVPYTIAEEIAGTWAGAVAGSLGFSGGWLLVLSAASRSQMSLGAHVLPGLITMEAGVVLGLTEALWRPLVLFPFEEAWSLILYRIDRGGSSTTRRPAWLRWHAAFWDEHQRLPLVGLDEHLVLVMERNPEEGRLALERLADGHQRWAAQAALIEIDALRFERCETVFDIGAAHRGLGTSELEGPSRGLLRRLIGISQDVGAALSQGSNHNQRVGLSAVERRLETLVGEVDRSSDRNAIRFRPIVARWRRLVQGHVRHLAEAVELRQEIDNPYVIGVPLTLEQELFVGRTEISARIEQLLLDRRRPPLLIHGQRRMGKTSLLNNLGRLLPTTIVPLFVDLQGPASSASDHAGLLYNLARGMIDSARKQRAMVLPPLPREALGADPFTSFDEWLDRVEGALGTSTALLALDELEALVQAIDEGRFSQNAVLGMLRHLVQHRQRIKVMFASSFTLDELGGCASYLINTQVIHVGYLKEDEARRLIEQPVKDMALRYEPDASRRVLSITRGHPFLIQLLCAEIVALKNDQAPSVRRLATIEDVMAAVPEALSHGAFFFTDIERNQVAPTALAILRWLTDRGEGVGATRDELRRVVPGDVEAALTQLQRRALIEAFAGGFRFQVELIRRWFAHGGDRHQA